MHAYSYLYLYIDVYTQVAEYMHFLHHIATCKTEEEKIDLKRQKQSHLLEAQRLGERLERTKREQVRRKQVFSCTGV